MPLIRDYYKPIFSQVVFATSNGLVSDLMDNLYLSLSNFYLSHLAQFVYNIGVMNPLYIIIVFFYTRSM